MQRTAEEKGEVFQLPDHLKARVDEQYKRDVAAVHGEEVAVKMVTEYVLFSITLHVHTYLRTFTLWIHTMKYTLRI